MATASVGKRTVLIGFNEEVKEVKEMLEKDMKAANIEIATSKKFPFAADESSQQWTERKCKYLAAVLVIMSHDWQEDDECSTDAEGAILSTKIYFANAKIFEENELTEKITGMSLIFDLSNAEKYLRNSRRLIDSLKQILGNPGNQLARISFF